MPSHMKEQRKYHRLAVSPKTHEHIKVAAAKANKPITEFLAETFSANSA